MPTTSFTVTLLRATAIGIAAAAALSLASCFPPQSPSARSDSPPPTPGSDEPAPAPKKRTSSYPLATPHPTNPKLVISPYKPHNVIDVSHLRSGQLAYDPSTAPLDSATGKPDMNRAKIFERP